MLTEEHADLIHDKSKNLRNAGDLIYGIIGGMPSDEVDQETLDTLRAAAHTIWADLNTINLIIDNVGKPSDPEPSYLKVSEARPLTPQEYDQRLRQDLSPEEYAQYAAGTTLAEAKAVARGEGQTIPEETRRQVRDTLSIENAIPYARAYIKGYDIGFADLALATHTPLPDDATPEGYQHGFNDSIRANTP